MVGIGMVSQDDGLVGGLSLSFTLFLFGILAFLSAHGWGGQ